MLPPESELPSAGVAVARAAGCHVAGGHSVDDPEPKYGMAVTGVAAPDRLLRNDAGRPGLPLTLTKPLGLGVLNSRHKATGEVFPHAVETMAALNRDASIEALEAGVRCATDVTGFMFPFTKLLPSHYTGIISLLFIALALLAHYVFHFVGAWRWIYAVSIGLAAIGKFDAAQVCGYIAAQMAGAVIGAAPSESVRAGSLPPRSARPRV